MRIPQQQLVPLRYIIVCLHHINCIFFYSQTQNIQVINYLADGEGTRLLRQTLMSLNLTYPTPFLRHHQSQNHPGWAIYWTPADGGDAPPPPANLPPLSIESDVAAGRVSNGGGVAPQVWEARTFTYIRPHTHT